MIVSQVGKDGITEVERGRDSDHHTVHGRQRSISRRLVSVEVDVGAARLSKRAVSDLTDDQVGPAAIGRFDRAAGTTATIPPAVAWWATTTTTVEDRLALLRTLVFPNQLLSPASRAYELNLMEHVTPSQDWGATGGVPGGVKVALKNGFALVAGWQMDTTGWVDGDGRDYLIAVLTNGNADESYGIATVNAISAIIWRAL